MGFDFDDEYHDLLPDIDKIDHEEGAGTGGKSSSSVRIDLDLCESSGACSLVCPEDVLEFRNGQPVVVQPDKCTECWICVENCVSGAIDIG